MKLKNHIIMLINTLATKNDLDSKKDYKRLNSIMLTSDEWDLIQDLIPVLQPYAEATELLGGSSYCTHSMMNPILINIKKRFHPSTSRGVAAAEKININFGDNNTAFDEDMAVEENEQLQAGIEDNERQLLTNNKRIQINNPVNCYGLIDQIKLSLFTAMNYYWNDLTSPDKLLPTLLDPRMKDLSFVSDSERSAAKDLLEEKYKELKFQDSNDNLLLPINVDDNRKKNKKAYTIFADLKKKIIPADDEIGNYLQLEEIDFEGDPFAWWYERKEKFPILTYLAKKYLAVYACSTASERLFSDAGNILTAKRARTCPNFFKKLIFLKRNGKHLDSIHGESSQES